MYSTMSDICTIYKETQVFCQLWYKLISSNHTKAGISTQCQTCTQKAKYLSHEKPRDAAANMRLVTHRFVPIRTEESVVATIVASFKAVLDRFCIDVKLIS